MQERTDTAEPLTYEEPVQELKSVGWCPLTMGPCFCEACQWWITDEGKEECAIVKLAKSSVYRR